MVWKVQLHMFHIYPKTKSAHCAVFQRETVLRRGMGVPMYHQCFTYLYSTDASEIN